MNFSCILLGLTSTSLLFKIPSASLILLMATIGLGFTYGVLSLLTIVFFLVFYGLLYLYFETLKQSPYLKNLCLLIILGMTISFFTHLIPGFKNPILINQLSLSSLSVPFSVYINFDKTIAGIILAYVSKMFVQEELITTSKIKIVAKFTLAGTIILMLMGLISGYIQFDFKLHPVLPIWIMTNLFFVCFAEEVFFRGFLQNIFKDLLAKYQEYYLHIIASALLFGIAHFKGGIFYVCLAFIAGLLYGVTYEKTKSILCAILVHFLINLIHIIGFTYPAALS